MTGTLSPLKLSYLSFASINATINAAGLRVNLSLTQTLPTPLRDGLSLDGPLKASLDQLRAYRAAKTQELMEKTQELKDKTQQLTDKTQEKMYEIQKIQDLRIQDLRNLRERVADLRQRETDLKLLLLWKKVESQVEADFQNDMEDMEDIEDLNDDKKGDQEDPESDSHKLSLNRYLRLVKDVLSTFRDTFRLVKLSDEIASSVDMTLSHMSSQDIREHLSKQFRDIGERLKEQLKFRNIEPVWTSEWVLGV